MALTRFQRTLCRVIAANRVQQGESYVAGGAALNLLAGGRRISRDIDLFHDTVEALDASWQADRGVLMKHGYELTSVRERPAYVEAMVSKGDEVVLVQWTRDSVFRFFPLMQHEELGLVLHPFDLATNKTLALIGRLEIRDWIDMITCHHHMQPLGYLAWAACGKDPGFSPLAILEHASRSGRYTEVELEELAFDGEPPNIGALSRQWQAMLAEAREIIQCLPTEHVGMCVLNRNGDVYTENAHQLKQDLSKGELLFHAGRIRGAYPQIVRSKDE